MTDKPIKVFGTYEEKTWTQMLSCMAFADYGVLSADNHLGYNHPVGAGTASEDYISVSGVGFDIGCGNKAVLTDLSVAEIGDDLPRIMDTISAQVAFGVGRAQEKPIDDPVIDSIVNSPAPFQQGLWQLAANQLGTVGGGNHYVDLFRDESDRVWIGVHFGSRGFGHKTASHYMQDSDMMGPPTVLRVAEGDGEEYLEAMTVAGAYAFAGRDIVTRQVLGILGAKSTYEVHNHHNYAWREEHFGRELWVVRKGCTPAFPGQEGFVGGSMGDISVILEGVDTPENRDGLYSTVHGAGRAMSRNAAAGKFKRKKTWECGHRDCSRQFEITTGPTAPAPKRNVCPDHPHSAPRKINVMVRTTEGAIDWDAALADLAKKGIELRGGAADEAPGAYKRIEDVLAAHGSTIKVQHVLHPLGVAMAPSHVPRDD